MLNDVEASLRRYENYKLLIQGLICVTNELRLSTCQLMLTGEAKIFLWVGTNEAHELIILILALINNNQKKSY